MPRLEKETIDCFVKLIDYLGCEQRKPRYINYSSVLFYFLCFSPPYSRSFVIIQDEIIAGIRHPSVVDMSGRWRCSVLMCLLSCMWSVCNWYYQVVGYDVEPVMCGWWAVPGLFLPVRACSYLPCRIRIWRDRPVDGSEQYGPSFYARAPFIVPSAMSQ